MDMFTVFKVIDELRAIKAKDATGLGSETQRTVAFGGQVALDELKLKLESMESAFLNEMDKYYHQQADGHKE